MALGSSQITTTSHDIFRPEIWAQETQRARETNKVMSKLVKLFSDDVAGKGDILNIQTIANLAPTAKSVNTQVTLQAPAESNIALNINRYFESSFLVEKSIRVQSQVDLMKEYVPKAAESIENQKDDDLLGLYSGLSQQVGGLGAALTEANFVRAIQYLDDADAPQSDRHFVIRPVVKADLIKLNKFTGVVVGVDTTSPGTARTMNIVETGKFGELYGVEIHVSTNVAADATTATIFHNLLFHREAFALAEQIPTTSNTEWIAEYIGWLHVCYGLWGRVEYRDSHGVDVRTT
jgi:hypothetical protein